MATIATRSGSSSVGDVKAVTGTGTGSPKTSVPVENQAAFPSGSTTPVTPDAAGSSPALTLSDEPGTPSPDRKDNEIVLEDQSTRLPLRRIMVIYFGIGIALIVSFIDQTSVSTAAPQIGTDLGGSATISWVGTAFLVANCAFQLVYGRLSDIFGRKNMLQIATALLAIGNLMCSFAQTPIELYCFRAISGIGGGGVNNIAMVVVSDIVPLRERGKYQGFITAATALGNAIGPFIGGGLAYAGQWRWLFRVTTLCGVLVIVANHFILPLKPVTGSIRTKLGQIDYMGIFLSATATILLLVPISGGGSTFSWSSAVVIVLLVVGGACGVAFTVQELRFTRLPILPMRIFKQRTSALVMISSFCIGVIYYGNIFFIPVYFQNVKGYSALTSGAFVLVYTFPQAIWGITSGYYISKTNHYRRVIILGATLWTLGLGLQLIWVPATNLGMILGFLEINSVGVGWSLQTTLVAVLAVTAAKDRAVVTASRNFFRTLGGAFGLAIANAVYQSVVKSRLELVSGLSAQQRSDLITSALSAMDSLSSDLKEEVKVVFCDGLRYVFLTFTAIGAVYIITSFFIEEIPFRKDAPDLEAEKLRARGAADVEKLEIQSAPLTGGNEEVEDVPRLSSREQSVETEESVGDVEGGKLSEEGKVKPELDVKL